MIDRLKQLLTPDVSLPVKLMGVSMFFAKMFEGQEKRLIDLEARQLQKGEQGEKGDRGLDGIPGKDGKTGPRGEKGKDGANGKDGATGPQGKTGKTGVGVADVTLAADSHLVVKLTDGKEIDVGDMELLMSASRQHIISTQLPNNQVYVSATAPANPSLNDLWMDIS